MKNLDHFVEFPLKEYILIDSKNKIIVSDFETYLGILQGDITDKHIFKKVKDTYVKEKLGKNRCNVYHISTVFLGPSKISNGQYCKAFETMIFDNNLSSDNYGKELYSERHSDSWKSANDIHQLLVRNLRKKFKQDGKEIFNNLLKNLKK